MAARRDEADRPRAFADNGRVEYVLGEEVYTGAETRVVAGLHCSTGTRVALKLPCDARPRASTLDKLRHEHALLCELAPLGGVQTLGLMPQGAGLALVMEWWGETSLSRLLSRGPLLVATALRLGARLARTLGKIHRAGIIHRDIKPQNVLVDAAQADVRLIDFGVAVRRPTHVEVAEAAEGSAGTLAYMAPEQTGRMRRAADARADLYALGASLYEMLTGTLPFETRDAMELIHAHIARTPAPPHERAPGLRIPEAVSAIVQRLLEKNPDRRYQTAEGAAFDLEQAERALVEAGSIGPFTLGTRDWEDRVRKPSRLFGREEELAALVGALEMVSAGAAKLVLVTGPSGVGKSALVQAFREQEPARRATFASGKFDQLKRGVAYDAVAQALRSVVRRKLAGPTEELARWTSTWQEAVGPNARLLVELLPELSRMLVESPPVPDLGPTEAKIRFQRTVQRFVRATAAAEHPLILFIDDLQWADTPSLELLATIAADPDAAHLLVIGAYRQDELTQARPLQALAATIAECGRLLPPIALAPLGDEALRALVGDLLSRPADEVRELSFLVKAKTDGSPFFVEQFLHALHERALLVRDLETGRWRWDIHRIEHARVTDNVVALLTAKITALPEVFQRVLSLAACIGPTFETALLGAASGLDLGRLRDALDDLSREGLIHATTDGEGETYAFVHDRVQQAAYAVPRGDERTRAHLAIAQELERRGGWATHDSELFALLGHYLLALPWLHGAGERHHLAELLLHGGVRAKATFAFEQAAWVLRAGRALLVELRPEDAPQVLFDVELLLAEVEWQLGNTETGASLFVGCQARAATPLAEGRIASAWVPLLVRNGRYQEALDHGMAALAALGYPLPRDADGQQRLSAALRERVSAAIAATSVEAWRALPPCADPAQRIAAELLHALLPAAAAAMSAIYSGLGWTLLDLTLTHGMVPRSMYAAVVASLSFVLDNELRAAVKCLELGLALQVMPGIPKGSAMYVAVFSTHYVKPIDRALDLMHEARDVAEREGDVMSCEFCNVVLPSVQCFRGLSFAHQTLPATPLRTAMPRDIIRLAHARHDALSRGGDRDAKALIASVAELETATVHVRFHVLAVAAYVALHLGEHAEALRLSVVAESLRASSTLGPTDLYTLLTLTLVVATWPPGNGEEAEALCRRATFHRSRLEIYAAFTPSTFRHMKLLVDAGEARNQGEHARAARLYDEAIADARQNAFTNGEALGLRLCGEHHLARGDTQVARTYLHDAHDAYLRWGALGAAQALRARHSELFPSTAPEDPSQGAAASPPHAATETRLVRSDLLDAVAMIRAAQTIAGELSLDKLVDHLMRSVLESAGAERGVLLLKQGPSLRIEAEISAAHGTVTPTPRTLLDHCASLPRSLIQVVAHTHEEAILDNASTDETFKADAYIARAQSKSLLCMPLLRQGDLKGVLYLENNLTTGAFTEARVQLIGVLCSQVAISLEIATLYADLERRVAERTRELKETQARLVELEKEATEVQMAGGFAQEMRATLAAAKLRLRPALGAANTPHRATLAADNSRRLRDLYLQVRDRLPPARRASVAATLQEINNNEEKTDATLRDVDETLDRALSSTRLILDYARLGQERRGREAVPVRAVVDAVLKQLCGELDKHGIAVYVDIEPGCVLVGSEHHFHSILSNLVVNARDALVEKTAPGARALRIAASSDAQRCTLIVADTGIGIPPEHHARIFDPFFSRKASGGTGLGLGVVRRLISLYQGEIEIESAPGAGTTFRCSLPLAAAGLPPMP